MSEDHHAECYLKGVVLGFVIGGCFGWVAGNSVSLVSPRDHTYEYRQKYCLKHSETRDTPLKKEGIETIITEK